MCSELHYLHVLGPVRYLLIVSIGMGSVYVIVYFATYIRYNGGTCVHGHTVPTLYMYCQLQLLQPKVESSSVMHMGGKRRTS